MIDRLTAAEVRRILGLEPLPVEGGWWAQTHRDEASSAIYYFLERGECSRLHRLDSPEIYHFYAGAPLALTLVDDVGVREVLVGPDLAAGQRPQVTVPAGVWQGSVSVGEWTLVGTTMAPPFTVEGCEFVDEALMAELVARYPSSADRLRRLA